VAYYFVHPANKVIERNVSVASEGAGAGACPRPGSGGMIARNFANRDFEHVGTIEPERAGNGDLRRFLPQASYRDAAVTPLYAYGAGPFGRFRIGRNRHNAGLCGPSRLKPTAVGKISPRVPNCFGHSCQSTITCVSGIYSREIMPLIVADFPANPECGGTQWAVSDEDQLATLTAMVLIGRAHAAVRVLQGAQAQPVITSAALKQRLRAQLITVGGPPTWHRDGLLFEIICWTVAHITAGPNEFVSEPHLSSTQQGYDTIKITASESRTINGAEGRG
jgi:hypothetical protein